MDLGSPTCFWMNKNDFDEIGVVWMKRNRKTKIIPLVYRCFGKSGAGSLEAKTLAPKMPIIWRKLKSGKKSWRILKGKGYSNHLSVISRILMLSERNGKGICEKNRISEEFCK